MPETVAEQEVEESQEGASEQEATPATPDPELATIKKRLAGKDQALTASQQRAAAAEAERDALRTWKAEKEQADMSEVDRLKAELAAAGSRAEQAEMKATRLDLARKFPLTFDLLGDATPLDEVKLAEIEARLKAEGESDEEAPRIDPNNPRRSTPKTGPRTVEDIVAEMRRTPIPTRV